MSKLVGVKTENGMTYVDAHTVLAVFQDEEGVWMVATAVPTSLLRITEAPADVAARVNEARKDEPSPLDHPAFSELAALMVRRFKREEKGEDWKDGKEGD